MLLGAAVLCGLAGGAFTQLARYRLDETWMFWINSVAGWCLPAFAVGALAARARRPELVATLAAVATELMMVAGYYGVRHAQGLVVPEHTVAVWTAAGVAGGVVFGVAGAWWRSASGARQGVGLALISAVLVGQGMRDQILSPGRPGHPGLVMVLVGLVAAFALARTNRQRIAVPALAVLLLPVVAVGWVLTYTSLSV